MRGGGELLNGKKRLGRWVRVGDLLKGKETTLSEVLNLVSSVSINSHVLNLVFFLGGGGIH